MTVWRMRVSCWILKATNTHSKYVILIAFSTATMVAMLRYMNIASLVMYLHASLTEVEIIFIVAPCILEIFNLLHTNECTVIL
jgi:hypothetical protein